MAFNAEQRILRLKVLTSIFMRLCLGVFILTIVIPVQVNAKKVDAQEYSSFWLWGNIRTAPYLSKAKEIYILQGEFRPLAKNNLVDARTPSIGNSRFTQQGVSILNIPQQKVWLVFRNHHLNWNQKELLHILKRVRQWENAGNQIIGIQIDYDSRTRKLHEYAIFLQNIRQQLPSKYQLSITGLLDWSNAREPRTLQLLKQNIHEIVVQTYQGTNSIPNYETYLKQFSTLKLPYKIGLVQHGQWQTPLYLKTDPHFKGFVVFLVRSREIK